MRSLLFIWGCLQCLHVIHGAPKRTGVKHRLQDTPDPGELSTACGSSSSASTASGCSKSTSSSTRSVRQRLTATCTADLPLVNSLRRDWAKGLISAKQVQEYAHGAQLQGANFLGDLAKAGTFGKNPQNIQRSLIQLFGKPVGAPDFNWFKIPLKNGRYALHPFLLPHKFFEQLYKERRQDFQRYLQGPVGAAQQYWEHLQDSAYVRLHPKLHSNNFATMIPLGLHGDAGAYSKQDSLMVISWNSILGRGNTRRKRFVFTFLRKRDYTPETLNAVWHIFASSINKLLECTEAGGWRATLSQVRGDWAFFCEIFRFPQWNAKDYMCWCCRASSSTAETFWTDVGPNAGWRHTLYTHESYLEHLAAMGLAIPVLFY
jgi:hypothetical protein